jgi:TetR/AcrR family transcriptional repressor of lmrAB and yxaGH operons
LDAVHLIAHRDDLSKPLVADCVPRGQWQPTVGYRDIQITTGDHQRPDQRLLGRRDSGFGDLTPCVSPCFFERQLPHDSILEQSLKNCKYLVNMPRPDRSRAALIDTAATLFRRQGYAATGLNQILAEAGVKPGSLYHHFPQGKQQLAAAVVDTAGGGIEQLLRRFLATDRPVADIVDRWIDLLVAGLAGDQRDGCPIEPIATESVNASPPVREASARAFRGWSMAIEDRLRSEGWSPAEAEQVALAVISLIEGALILSRIAGDAAALHAAKPAARTLLRR